MGKFQDNCMNEALESRYKLKNFLHDISSPLTTVKICLEILHTMLKDSENCKEANLLERTISGMEQIHNLIKAAKADADCQKEYLMFSASAELNNILHILNPVLNQAQIVVCANLAEDLQISGSPALFRRAIVNLLNNSIESMADNGNRQRKLGISTGNNCGSFFINITDNGQGINKKDLPRVGSYCFTTKKTGSGIGLAEAKDFFAGYFHAELLILSRFHLGTQIFIRFPQYPLL